MEIIVSDGTILLASIQRNLHEKKPIFSVRFRFTSDYANEVKVGIHHGREVQSVAVKERISEAAEVPE
jgi:hypothetical protein